jgi:transcriptional regulator with XRE-family HTH domain
MQELTPERLYFATRRLKYYMDLGEETQPSLEAKSGIAQSTISRILKGSVTPTVETLTKLFDAMGVPLEEIYEHDPIPNRFIGYLATPLTSVASIPHADSELRKVVDAVRQVASGAEFADPPFSLYWPGDHTHPSNRHVTDRQVYRTDRSHASAHHFIILFCAEASYGVGQENEIATQAGLPAIRIVPKTISRMMTGSYLRTMDVPFSGTLQTRVEFDKQVLREKLRAVRKQIFQIRAYYGGPNGNVLSSRLKSLLASRDLSIGELAERIGVGPDYVEAMCKEHVIVSNPSIRILRRIARQLNVPTSFLLGEEYDELWNESRAAWYRWVRKTNRLNGEIAVRIWEEWESEYAQFVQVNGAPSQASHRSQSPQMDEQRWDERYQSKARSAHADNEGTLF